MGLRVRKSVKIGKYLKVNFNKSGISLSGGVRGASVAFKKGIDHYMYGELDQAKDLCQQSLNLVNNPMAKILLNDIDKK